MEVNKIVYYGKTLVDMTGVTVKSETLIKGATALDASGKLIEGTAPTEDEVIASLPTWTGGSY